ncbi:unnamed protein product, partial [Musa textilis]
TTRRSLRSCSLVGGGGAEQSLPRLHVVGASGESVPGITVELNSDAALPYHREKCLDMLVRSPLLPFFKCSSPLFCQSSIINAVMT